jgi:hypothetical protein
VIVGSTGCLAWSAVGLKSRLEAHAAKSAYADWA